MKKSEKKSTTKIDSRKISMSSMSLAVRITLDEVQVRAMCERWTPYCEQIIAYEHPSGVPARTHCHLLLIGCSVTTARLKQLANRIERGNQFWNFKTAENNISATYKYVTYMSKGIYEPFWIGSEMHIEYKDFEKLKGQWVEPVKPPVKLTMLQRYQEFEKLVRLMPIEQRNDETWIKLHARAYLFPQYQMVTQQYKNDMSNFIETYKIKYLRQ